MTQDKRPEDFQNQIEAEEIAIIGDDAMIEGNVILGNRGIGGDLFGPATAPTRYRCAGHGVILAADVLWRRDDNPYCPHCGNPLEEIE